MSSTSHPEFGHDTKATEVAAAFSSQIKDRVVVITGVSRGGIGGATALAFARHRPALLILVSRTQAKLDEIVGDIQAIDAGVRAVAVRTDLTSQAAVRQAAARVAALTPRVDVLVNNAGLVVTRRGRSPEGLELQLAGNHVGPFLLTNLLRAQLLRAGGEGGARVVNVSSEGHRSQPFRFHDYNNEGRAVPADEEGNYEAYPAWSLKPVGDYVSMKAYGHTKTANVLFTVALNQRFAGTGVVSYAVHPGTLSTEVTRDFTDEDKEQMDAFLAALNPKPSPDEGAATSVVAALDPALAELKSTSEVYLDDCQFRAAEPHAVDAEKAERLWKLSEELVTQAF